MKRGDILEYKRANGLFYHYALYKGEDKVIHRDKGRGVFVSELDDMIGEMRITSPKYPRVPTQQAIDKAFEKVEDKTYNPITNNCEHFVNFVRYHRTHSKQVKKLFILGGYMILTFCYFS